MKEGYRAVTAVAHEGIDDSELAIVMHEIPRILPAAGGVTAAGTLLADLLQGAEDDCFELRIEGAHVEGVLETGWG